MPLTFPAHQAPVLPLKLWRPRWFDGTALCIGAAAPDLYPLSAWMNRQSHTAIGVALGAIPFTVLVCALLRWGAAAGIFAHLPDAGPLRLRSYRVLARRRPAFWITLLSAVLGAGSHVVIDAFTHDGRWGAAWLGLDLVLGHLPGGGKLTLARALQYLGHTAGSLSALGLFAHIGRERLLERWYGAEAVKTARAVVVTVRQRIAFWAVALTPPLTGGVWSPANHRGPVFAVLAATCLGLLLAGSLPLYEGQVSRDSSGFRHVKEVLCGALVAAGLILVFLFALTVAAYLYVALELPGAAGYMSD